MNLSTLFKKQMELDAHITQKRGLEGQTLLDKLNYIAGQHFNWIPSDAEQEKNEQAKEFVAKEFGNMGEVELISG